MVACSGSCPCESRPSGCVSLCYPLLDEPPPPPPPEEECKAEAGNLQDADEDAVVQGACRRRRRRSLFQRKFCYQVCDLHHPPLTAGQVFG